MAARPQARPLATHNTKVPSRLGYCILYCLPCYLGLWLTIRIFPEQRPAAGRCPPISHQLTCCAVLLNAPVCSCGVQWFSLQVLWCATPVFPSQKPTVSLLKSVDSHGSRIQISTCSHYHSVLLQSLQSCPMLTSLPLLLFFASVTCCKMVMRVTKVVMLIMMTMIVRAMMIMRRL